MTTQIMGSSQQSRHRGFQWGERRLSPVRAIIYGMGRVGRVAAQFLTEKGAHVVAAYSRHPEAQPALPAALSQTRLCAPDVPFETFQADVVLFTHGSSLATLWEPARRAAMAGMDAITIADEAFDPFCFGEELQVAVALDRLFKQQGRTLAALGIQDSFWFAQPLALSAAVQRIDRIHCTNVCDLADFGSMTKDELPIGVPEAEFALWAARKAHGRGAMEIALRPVLRAMGLGEGRFSRHYAPLLARAPMDLPAGRGHIAQGCLRGMVETVRFDLKGGEVAEGRFVSAYLEPGESAYNEWRIEGLPDVTLRSDALKGAELSMASVINRIPDVLAAPPGFLGVERLGLPRYRRSLAPPPKKQNIPTDAEGLSYDQFRPQ